MKNILFTLLVVSCLLSGCGTPGQAYAKQHPELSQEHRQILMTGKIPDGTAVAGMTRDQILLIMGPDVTQYTKVDGHDAWVYVRKKLTSEPLTSTTADFGKKDNRNQNYMDDSGSTQGADKLPQVRTTIIFDGDVATHAEVANGGL